LSRKEFSKATKVEVIKRATKNGNVYCEACGALAKKWEIDHVQPDGLCGSNLLANAQLLCRLCHVAKTKDDVARIAKAKRVEARALGVRKRPTLKSRGFEKTAKPPKEPLRLPPRRSLYEDEQDDNGANRS
jgi:5-methylcytosine-specific restriction endonuclease McrA